MPGKRLGWVDCISKGGGWECSFCLLSSCCISFEEDEEEQTVIVTLLIVTRLTVMRSRLLLYRMMLFDFQDLRLVCELSFNSDCLSHRRTLGLGGAQ